MPEIKYVEETIENLRSQVTGNLVLLVTATELESRELHKILTPLPQYDNILIIYEGALTYYVGVIGRYIVAHVQCSMGSISRDSSIITTSEAIKILQTNVVIMVGIAFGVDRIKQQIGDVLIAEAVQPYNNKRVGAESEIQRGYAVPSSKILLNRFKNLKSWEYLLPDLIKAKLHFSLILSGEELIDNKIHRDELVKKYPMAAGGEMEGAGIYAACDGKANCILVKGICDFADGLKGVDKEKNQQIAIESALSVCVDLFSSKTAFSELGISPLVEDKIGNTVNAVEINEVLFEIYDITKEKYYIDRELDGNFLQMINHFGVWIYGISGCGKSTLILRNLIRSELNFIQVNLASCVGLTIEAFFTEILFDLAGKIEGVYSQVQPTNFPECVRLLLALFEKNYQDKELIVFIEEIPLETDVNYQEFTQKIYSLLVSKALIPGLVNVRFILSSINDPTTHIQSFNQKIYTQLKFNKLEHWSN